MAQSVKSVGQNIIQPVPIYSETCIVFILALMVEYFVHCKELIVYSMIVLLSYIAMCWCSERDVTVSVVVLGQLHS